MLTRQHRRQKAQKASSLLVVFCAIAGGMALAVEAEADIPGVTRPTNMPTPTRVLRNGDLPSFNARCNPDHPDSCAALAMLAVPREDDQIHFEKRQEPGEDETSSRVVNVPQNAPNGGLSMTQPPITAQATVCRPSVHVGFMRRAQLIVSALSRDILPVLQDCGGEL